MRAGDFEYPVLASGAPDPIIAALGQLSPDRMPLGQIASNRKRASALVERVGFDR